MEQQMNQNMYAQLLRGGPRARHGNPTGGMSGNNPGMYGQMGGVQPGMGDTNREAELPARFEAVQPDTCLSINIHNDSRCSKFSRPCVPENKISEKNRQLAG